MTQDYSFAPHEVAPYINYAYFFHAWGVKDDPALRADAEALLREIDPSVRTHARVRLLLGRGEGDNIATAEGSIPLLRQQRPESDGHCWCVADFLPPEGATFGLFATTVDALLEEGEPSDPYRHLLRQTLADRLAEATAEKVHEHVRRTLWGYAPDERLTPCELFQEKYQGLRPAVGYPSLPDQSLNFLLARLLDFPSLGIRLTESGLMRPHASTSGLMFSHARCRHFSVGPVSQAALDDYARRRGTTPERLAPFVPTL